MTLLWPRYVKAVVVNAIAMTSIDNAHVLAAYVECPINALSF